MSIHPVGDVHPVDAVRFWIWVEKSGPDECWDWQGRLSSDGIYGRWRINGWDQTAQRVAWAIENGEIPAGMVIDHRCHNTLCVNPRHLHPVTPKQNIENMLPVRAKSGYRGVHRRADGKYRACVVHNRKKHQVEPFDTPEEANEAAIALRNKLFTNNLLDPR